MRPLEHVLLSRCGKEGAAKKSRKEKGEKRGRVICVNEHKISEYIENLTFKKKLFGGCCEDDVYEAIRQISSMYSELLEEAYGEIEELRKQAAAQQAENHRKSEEVGRIGGKAG